MNNKNNSFCKLFYSQIFSLYYYIDASYIDKPKSNLSFSRRNVIQYNNFWSQVRFPLLNSIIKIERFISFPLREINLTMASSKVEFFDAV